MIWLLSRQLARPATHRKTEKDRDNLLTGEGGGGWWRSQIRNFSKKVGPFEPNPISVRVKGKDEY
jgi:hypothetical protein